jgi:hypothetical protein
MRIKQAAIMQLDTKKVWTGPDHGTILQKMAAGGVDRLVCVHAEQGFVTECGRFVRRKPALCIAKRSGQVKEGKLVAPHVGLFSEDLRQ